ncbi:hypothetical protein GCM10017784_35260 [Deinococcus indicus]|uniref:hypothetical protein n=1 Tax=Deinococcus indicus TaxID=223556 RepID=UPI001748FE6D|nr:hypothetical protein [Deinococcus indicus]GHG37752.1 hypothetical protein GCM10017784_35260 [Deinococcus indicus]
MRTDTLNIADTSSSISVAASGSVQTELGLTPDQNETCVRLTISTDHVSITLHLEPLEAVELATNLLLYARAAEWDGEVL